MNVFHGLKIGFGMARRSGRVLRAYPKLLVFPFVGGLSGVAFLLTLFGGLIVAGSLLEESGVALYVGLFLAYLVETFIASFFTAALITATRDVFDGRQLSIRTSLSTAWDRKLLLLVWSVVAAIIGVIVRSIEGQDNIVAKIAAVIFAAAWGVMTYFIVPVIIFREPSLRGMFKQSAATFKRTWGESIGAMGAINVVTFLLAVAGIAFASVVFVLTAGLGSVQLVATVTVGGAIVLVGILIGKALTGIAKTALYMYATEQAAPEYFEDLDFARLDSDRAGSTNNIESQGSGPDGGRI
jgi:hypothetical protein